MTDTGARHMIVVVEQAASRLGFYDPADGSKLGDVSVGFWPHEVIISRDGKTAYVSNFGLQDYDERIGKPGASISVIDIPNMCEQYRLYTFNTATGEVYKAPHGIKLTPDERQLFVSVEQGYNILVFALENRTLERVFTIATGRHRVSDDRSAPTRAYAAPSYTHNMVFSPEGRALWLMSGPNGIYHIDPATGQIVWHIATPTPVQGLAYTADQRYLIASGRNEIILFDPQTYGVYKHFTNLGVDQLLYSIATPDDKYILGPAVWDSQLIILEVATGKVVHRTVTGLDPVHVAVSPDGKTAYVTNARSAYVSTLNLETFAQGTIPNAVGPNGIATCPYYAYKPRKTLTFGAVLPLSGADAASGRELCIGYEFWKESVNAAGGLLIKDEPYCVQTAYLDNQSDHTQTKALTYELLGPKYGTQFLLGSYPTSANFDAAGVAEEYNIPMVTASGAGRTIYEQGYRYIFGIMSPAGGYLRGSIDVAILQEPKPATTVILSCNDAAALEDAQDTAQYARAKGLKMSSPSPEELPPGFHVEAGIVVYTHNAVEDFRPIMRTLKTLRPDFFIGTGHLTESENIVQAAAEVDFKPMGLTFSVGPSLPAFYNTLGELAQYILGATQWTPEAPIRGYDLFLSAPNFADTFYQRYNMPASYLSAGAVACGVVFQDALRTAHSDDPQQVREALAGTDTSTFFARIQLNEQGLNADKPMITIQLKQQDHTWESIVLWPKDLAGANKPVWPFPGWPVGK